MPSLLQQLGNTQAILLLYMADELPAEDHAQVQRMLADDPQLRAELAALRWAHEAVVSRLADLDCGSPLPVSEPVLVRQVVRAVRQRQLERVVTTPVAPQLQPKSLRYPWWVYPTAAAAAVLLAFLTWWGNFSQPSSPVAWSPEQAVLPAPDSADDPQAQQLAESLLQPVDGEASRQQEHDAKLAELEEQVLAMSNGGTSDLAWSPFSPAGEDQNP